MDYFFLNLFLRISETFYPKGKQTEIRFKTQYLTWNCEALSTMENLL